MSPFEKKYLEDKFQEIDRAVMDKKTELEKQLLQNKKELDKYALGKKITLVNESHDKISTYIDVQYNQASHLSNIIQELESEISTIENFKQINISHLIEGELRNLEKYTKELELHKIQLEESNHTKQKLETLLETQKQELDRLLDKTQNSKQSKFEFESNEVTTIEENISKPQLLNEKVSS